MSEPFIARQPSQGYCEKREKSRITSREWKVAPEVISREQCDRMNREPNATYEYRWVEK